MCRGSYVGVIVDIEMRSLRGGNVCLPVMVLHLTNIEGHIRMCTLLSSNIGFIMMPHWQHDLISHTVTLF